MGCCSNNYDLTGYYNGPDMCHNRHLTTKDVENFVQQEEFSDLKNTLQTIIDGFDYRINNLKTMKFLGSFSSKLIQGYRIIDVGETISDIENPSLVGNTTNSPIKIENNLITGINSGAIQVNSYNEEMMFPIATVIIVAPYKGDVISIKGIEYIYTGNDLIELGDEVKHEDLAQNIETNTQSIIEIKNNPNDLNWIDD